VKLTKLDLKEFLDEKVEHVLTDN